MQLLRSTTLLCAALVLSNKAAAQQALLGPGAAYIAIGSSSISTEDLAQRLSANGYPTFGQSAKNVGIGAYRTLSNGLMLGGEFNGIILDEKTHNGREMGVGGGYATLSIARRKRIGTRTRVYPRLGFGVGGLGIWIQQADTVLFNDVLANPSL